MRPGPGLARWPCGGVEGQVSGTLTFPPRGHVGFGFDPVFVPDGYDQTFAELDPAQKHAISHRADAFKKLVAGALPKGDCFLKGRGVPRWVILNLLKDRGVPLLGSS